MSDSLRPHESQHSRPPYPSTTPKFTQTHVHRVGDAIQPSHPLSTPSPPAPNPSQHQGLFQWVNMRWPKYWGFSFNISPSNEQPGLISFRMDWLDLLAVQGTLKSLLQHHSSKASILPCSAFFIARLSHRYMTTGKTIALTRRTFVGKVMSLLFNMLSRLVITFLPRSKRLLISWLQSPSAMIFPTPLGCHKELVELPESNSKFPLAIYFTYSDIYVSMLLPQFLSPSPSPCCVPKSLLYVCFSIPALQIGSSFF